MTEILHKDLAFKVVGAAMEVHRELGPGFLESVYQRALAVELKSRGIPFEEHCRLPVHYKGEVFGEYETDILVENRVILELKASSSLTAAHQAQARHYLSATGLRLALLINFGQESLVTKRVVQ